MQRDLNAVDLFCGCGGATQGYTDAGLRVRMGIDYDEKILETYKNNFDHPGIQHDLSDWRGAVKLIREKVPDCNVIVGSPPCTEFSRAGKQIEGEVASLTICYANIVTELLPDFFIMENVPDVAQSNSLRQAVDHLTEYGYSVVSIIRDAKYCGVPQNRRRFFMIGCPASDDNERKLAQLVQDAAARGNIIGVKEYCHSKGVDCPDFLYFFPRNKFQAQVVSSNQPYPTMRSTNGVCMNKNPLTENYVRRPNDAADLTQAATISVQLASTISSFPVTFLWPESRKDVGIQLGNCVPPGLAQWVGTLVLRCLNDPIDTSPTKPGKWLLQTPKKQLLKVSHAQQFFQRIEEAGGEPDGAAIKIKHLNNTRDTNTAFRSEDIANDAREIYYTIGDGDATIDEAASTTMGFELKHGWTFLIKERICQASRIDDLFVIVPGQPVPFRGKAMLIQNGLLV